MKTTVKCHEAELEGCLDYQMLRVYRRTYPLLQCAQCYCTLLMITMECTMLLHTAEDHTGVHNVTAHC